MATMDELHDQVVGMRAELKQHIDDESSLFAKIEEMIGAHGDMELIPVRIQFINQWMQREAERAADRRALRKAIIEKTLSGLLWALLLYLLYAVGHDVKDMVVEWKNAKP